MKRMTGLMLLGLLVLINCSSNNDSEQVKEEIAGDERIPVEISRVLEANVWESVRITGEIAPKSSVDIFPNITGLVTWENVELGETVQTGRLLARVKQDIPGMDYSPVEITATAPGIISMDAVETGSRVSPQQPLYRIDQINQVYMIGKIVESQLNRIRRGSGVEINVEAYPDKTFPGEIREIVPLIDPVSRMGTLKILIQNQGRQLKPGMFATAGIKIDQHKSLVVPLDAIVPIGVNRFLFKIEDDIAHRVLVTTGKMMNQQVAVEGDLRSGDAVVVLGQNLLDENTPVRIVKELENENR